MLTLEKRSRWSCGSGTCAQGVDERLGLIHRNESDLARTVHERDQEIEVLQQWVDRFKESAMDYEARLRQAHKDYDVLANMVKEDGMLMTRYS